MLKLQLIMAHIERFLWRAMRRFMPRWSIFIIDIAIVSLSFISIWFFQNAISGKPLTSDNHPLLQFLIANIIYSVCFLIFKPYHSIIRFSTMRDLSRIVISTIVATLIYLCATMVSKHLYSEEITDIYFSYIIPTVLGMLVLSGQLLLRFVVKGIFERFEKMRSNKVRVFILGADLDSVLLANNISADIKNRYIPIAFVSFSHSQIGKSINRMPILSGYVGISDLMSKYDVQTMLLYRSQLNFIPKEFYEKCIVEGLELLLVSTYTRYDSNQDSGQTSINKIKIEDLLGRNTINTDRDNLYRLLTGKTILITGAAGSIGSEISRQVLSFDCEKVLLLDQAETPLNDLWLELLSKYPSDKIEPIVADVTNRSKVFTIFEKYRPAVVFHAAAYKHVPMMEYHPSTASHTNIGGTKIVADLSVEFGVKKFVMVSTDKAVNPTNVMGATKRAAEIYIQSLYFKLINDGVKEPTQFVTTRFGNVLGSNGSVVPLFKKQIEEGGPITITHRDVTRFFMTIPEACSLVLEAGCMGKGGEIYVFDMGNAVKIYELAEKMIRLSGKIPHKDILIKEIGLRPGEKLYEEVLSEDETMKPTYHPKVRIASIRQEEYDKVSVKIDSLLANASKFTNPEIVVAMLKDLIPEYKSMNSKYSELDNKSN